MPNIPDIDVFIKIVKMSNSINTIAKNLKWNNGKSFVLIKELIKYHNIDISHFDLHAKTRKYKIVSKICPICNTVFKTKEGSRDEKTTCSHSCANQYYRTGINNGNYKGTHYTTICFKHHHKKCIICGETNIVEVHHFDGNHSNNLPENLIPLCPTHHQYWHSKYRHIIELPIIQYVNDYIANHK